MRKGFSLVELMIVVAIIGLLAAIAIPNFVAMQLKAKRPEVPGNIDGIKSAEAAYEAAYDRYTATSESPRAMDAGDSTMKSAVSWRDRGNFATLGWSPDGYVRGTYVVATTSTATACGDYSTGSTPDFCVHGQSDVDANAAVADYYASRSTNTAIKSGDEGTY